MLGGGKEGFVSRGFALPVTILLMGALAVLLAGMLTVARLERQTARAYSDAYRAELALESGIEAARAVLGGAGGSDDFVVLEARDERGARYTFIAEHTGGEAGAWEVTPLFSGAAEAAAMRGSLELPPPALGGGVEEAVEADLGPDWEPHPRVGWVPLRAEDPATGSEEEIGRYCFWAEDLAGYVDAEIAGARPRGDGVDPRELQMATLLDATAETRDDLDGARREQYDRLDGNREHLESLGTVLQLLGGDGPESLMRNIAVGMREDLEHQVIPRGMGFAAEAEGVSRAGGELGGKVTRALNEYVAEGDVEGLAAFLAAAYPRFGDRKGSLGEPHDYFKTIAAGIIDYADADGQVSVEAGKPELPLPQGPGDVAPWPEQAGQWPSYRGMEGVPFVNLVFDEYHFKGETGEAGIFEVNTWVEFWNLSDRRIRGSLRIRYWNRNVVTYNGPHRVAEHYGDPQVFLLEDFSMTPNGFEVVELSDYRLHGAAREWRIPLGGFHSGLAKYPGNSRPGNSWIVEWKDEGSAEFVLADASGFVKKNSHANKGAQRQSHYKFFGVGERKWKGNAIPFYPDSGEHGDPRGSLYNRRQWSSLNYAERSSWQGANTAGFGTVDPMDWPDAGHSTREAGILGGKPGSDHRRPDSVPRPPAMPDLAPMHISNRGRYDSLAELGHVFDPAQWRDVRHSGSGVARYGGGGFTLRVGYPEFAVFGDAGEVKAPAARLLDLLVLDAAGGARGTRGLVNLNTARRDVLRALCAGVRLTADPGRRPEGAMRAPFAEQTGDLFAEAVERSRPFRSRSELGEIRTADGRAFFGDLAQWRDGSGPEATDDEGREELFRRIHELTTTRSRNFRVWVVGQVRARDGSVEATRAKVCHLFLRPEREAGRGSRIVDGSVADPVVVFEKRGTVR